MKLNQVGKKPKSFRLRILRSMISCAVVVAVITALLMSLRTTQLARKQLVGAMDDSVNFIQYATNLMSQSAEGASSSLMLNSAVQDVLGTQQPESHALVAEELKALTELMDGYTLLGKEQSVRFYPNLYITGRPAYDSFSFSDQVHSMESISSASWVQNLSDVQKLRAIGVFTTDDGRQVVRMARGLINPQSHDLSTKGILTLDLDMEDLHTMLLSGKPVVNACVTICTKDGIVLLSTEEQAGAQGADMAYSQREGDTFFVSGENMGRYLSVRQLQSIDCLLFVSCPAAEILEPLYSFVWVMGLVVVLAGALSALLGLVVSNRLTEPIDRISQSMEAVTEGKEHQKLEPSGVQEFDELVTRYNEMVSRTGSLLKRSVESEKSQREAEFQALQAQIHPHFLYNTLDAVNWLAIAYDVPDISTIVTALSDFFRLSLSGGKNIITLQNEFKHVKSYLEILKVRLGDHIRYELDLPEDLVNCAVAKLTLQPLVENAVEHGLRPKEGGGTVWIYARREGENLMLYVENDGVACSLAELEACLKRESKKSSFGVYNVNARIRTVYGEGFGLSYSQREGGGLIAKVKLPIKTLDDMGDLM